MVDEKVSISERKIIEKEDIGEDKVLKKKKG